MDDNTIAKVLGELYRVVDDHEVGMLDYFVLRSGLRWRCEAKTDKREECGYHNGRDDRVCGECGTPKPPRLRELMVEDVDWLQSDGHDVQALVERWVAAAYPKATGAEIDEDLSLEATFNGRRLNLCAGAFCEWLREQGVR